MNREEVLSLLKDKKFGTLVRKLSEEKVFYKLSEDPIFNTIFWDNFLPELLNTTEKVEERIMVLTQLHIYHKSSNHPFSFRPSEIDQVGHILVKEYQSISIARDFQKLEIAKGIIKKHEEEVNTQIEKNRVRGKLKRDFSLKQPSASGSQETRYIIEVFKSPQEKEVFEELYSQLGNNFIVLPNVAMSTIISDSILEELPKVSYGFFFSTTLDIAVVDRKNGKTVMVIELDSSYHDNSGQRAKDFMKDEILEHAGINLIRLRRKSWKTDPNYTNVSDFINSELKEGQKK